MRSLAVALLAVLLPVSAGARCPKGASTAGFLSSRFAVGVRTLTLQDTTRTTPASGDFAELPGRTLPVEVWYPTTGPADASPVRDARPSRRGPFPLVVNSPGLLDGRFGEAYLAVHLASRGFVVASIDFPLTSGSSLARGGPNLSDFHNQPGDVRFVIDELLRRARRRGEWLRGGIARRRIGLSGLSFGGGTTLLATYHPTLRDPRIRAALTLAPSACFFGPAFYQSADTPLLILHGDQDLIAPLAPNGGRVFAGATRSPRTLVTLTQGSHTAFAGVVVYPSTTSYDTLGCGAVGGTELSGDPLTGLGGVEHGIDASACTMPCTDPLPPNPPMQALRQHELTVATGTAFFEATLRRKRGARCFLADGLAAENADVTVQSAPGESA